MAIVFKQLAVIGLAITALAGCQSIDLNTVKLKTVTETEQTKRNALIYCSGTADCEFERFDKIPVIDSKSHRLEREALRKKIIRLQTNSLKNSNSLYLSVPEGQHEVVIRYYPISKDKAETLHIIHNFKASTSYTLKMFRERSKNKGSLLTVSPPEPLCVDLKQDKKTIRRFCKPYNVLNGLGEFVEQKNFKSL